MSVSGTDACMLHRYVPIAFRAFVKKTFQRCFWGYFGTVVDISYALVQTL